MTSGHNGVTDSADYKRTTQTFTIEDVCIFHKNLIMKPGMMSVAR